VEFDRTDNWPAFIADDGGAFALDGVRVERGGSSPYDVGVRGIRGYTVTGSTTSGATLRVRATGSTP
jgi:hypothetical protein